MFDPTRISSQAVIPFACPPCPFRVTGRCKGSSDGKTYLIQSPSVVGCISDPDQFEPFFADTYDEFIPIPKSSYHDEIQLPPFIPGIKTSGLSLRSLSKDLLFAVSYKDVIGKSGKVIVESVEEVRHKFKLPYKSRVALIGTTKDWHLEKIWQHSDTKAVWRKISEVGFDFVTSPTFSVWDESPRRDQIRNQDRNLRINDILCNLGVPSIPFVYPFDESDYESLSHWLEDRPDINKLAVLAHFYKSKGTFPQLLENMKRIEHDSKRKIEFLVVGVAAQYKIIKILSEFKASIISWKPFQSGVAGKRAGENLTYPKNDLLRFGFSREELAVMNIEKYANLCTVASAAA